ncbi:MAG: DoxX family protein [Flavobacteriaceae bacterium]
MKAILKILIIIVSVTVITAWTYNINLDTTFRGGDATNMIEEFEAYGLNQTTMVVVGIFKVSCAIMLLFGLKYRKLILPSAGVMALFMIAAVYFHLSISDPIIPTAPSLLMLASCLSIIYLDRRI